MHQTLPHLKEYIPRSKRDISTRMENTARSYLRSYDTNSAMQKIMPAIMQRFCDEAGRIVEGMVEDSGLKKSKKVTILIKNAIRNKANEILVNSKQDKKTSDFDLSVGQYWWPETKWAGGRDACRANCGSWKYIVSNSSEDCYAFRNNNFPIPFLLKALTDLFRKPQIP